MAGGATFGMHMKYRVLAFMLLVALIPLGGLWYISVYKARYNALTETNLLLKNSVNALAERADDWYTANLIALQQISSTADIRSMDGARQSLLLQTIPEHYQHIYLAFVAATNGQSVGRSDGKPAQYYGDREYFKEIMGGQLVGSQVAIGKTSGKPTYILAVPVYDAERQRRGVLAFAMTLEEVSKQIADVQLGSSGFATLMDAKNRVLAKGRALATELQDMSSSPMINAALNANEQPYEFVDQGKSYLAISKTTKHGWRIVVQQEKEEALSAMRTNLQHAFLFIGLTMVAVILVAFACAAGLTRPINNLTQITERMSKGELGATIQETLRRDEIGALARAIERMGISLEMAFKRMRK